MWQSLTAFFGGVGDGLGGMAARLTAPAEQTQWPRAITDLKLSQNSPRRQDASVFVQCPVLDALRKKHLVSGLQDGLVIW